MRNMQWSAHSTFAVEKTWLFSPSISGFMQPYSYQFTCTFTDRQMTVKKLDSYPPKTHCCPFFQPNNLFRATIFCNHLQRRQTRPWSGEAMVIFLPEALSHKNLQCCLAGGRINLIALIDDQLDFFFSFYASAPQTKKGKTFWEAFGYFSPSRARVL